MTRLRRGLLMLALVAALVLPVGCASSNYSSSYYQRSGSIHRDSFPRTYGYGYGGGYYRYGRPGRY